MATFLFYFGNGTVTVFSAYVTQETEGPFLSTRICLVLKMADSLVGVRTDSAQGLAAWM